jgi:hypothetical protein
MLVCARCNPGYYVNAGTCTACSANCLLCRSGSACDACKLSAYLSAGNCLACITGCGRCTGPSFAQC